MMNWLYYLLEANLYLTLFYGFYRLLLHRETFYTLNRYFLISSTLLSFLLPALQFSYLNSIFDSDAKKLEAHAITSIPLNTASGTFSETGQILSIVYLLIFIMLLTKIMISLYQVLTLAINAKRQKKGKVIYVELQAPGTAFSFFNLLFIYPGTKDMETILEHEMVHIQQKHSLDVFFFELVRMISWFNPVSWLIRNDVRLLHEYIADDLTTNSVIQKHEYALLLIRNSLGNLPSPLTNQIFNRSILKMRINMLNKKRSAGRARLRILCAIPLTGGMLCISTLVFSKDYKVMDLYAKKHSALNQLFQEPEKKTEVKLVPPPPPPASPKQVRKAKNSKPVPAPPAPPKKQHEPEDIKFPPPEPPKKQHAPEDVKFPPPEPPKKQKKSEQFKFPPPVVKPIEKQKVQSGTVSVTDNNLGQNPLYINDSKQTIVNPGPGKVIKFTARSIITHPKNDPATIKKYGEAARDGVIEMEDGKFFYAEPENKKKE